MSYFELSREYTQTRYAPQAPQLLIQRLDRCPLRPHRPNLAQPPQISREVASQLQATPGTQQQTASPLTNRLQQLDKLLPEQ